MTITELAIKRPSIIVVIFAVLSVLGIFSFTQLNYETSAEDLSAGHHHQHNISGSITVRG